MFFQGNPLNLSEDIVFFGMKVFFFVWIVFVPVAITARLEKIIKLLEEKRK